MKKACGILLMLLSISVEANAPSDDEDIIRIFKTLASDQMQGRAAGTEGGEKAHDFLYQEIRKLSVFDKHSSEPFKYQRKRRGEEAADSGSYETGKNLIALIDTDDQDTGPLLVISAHFDHLGVAKNGDIYNGADDNASGSAALFAIAKSFAVNPPQHDIMFAWLDAEEYGHHGAKALIASRDQFNGRKVFNLNLDMVSQNQDTLYYAGVYHYPNVKPLIERAAASAEITVRYGHDSPADGANDWTNQSDHAAFHAVGIPFGYFGVEDHPHYHRTTDKFKTIPIEFYQKVLATLVTTAHLLDDELTTIADVANSKTP